MKLKLLLLIALMSSGFVLSQNNSIWQKQTINNNLRVKQSKLDLPRTNTFVLNAQSLEQALVNTPLRNDLSSSSNVIVSFPNAEGVFERFRIYESTTMHPDLAARFPEIKSYKGQGIDDPSAVIFFSMSHLGFQSMRLSATKPATFIEAITEDVSTYAVFSRDQKINMNDDFECSVTESMNKILSSDNMAYRNADDGILRNYRLAVSATGEYTNYHGGTVADALAAINQTMVRVNGIFEIDFNVNMTLIANTDDVIFTNTATDPYGNTTGNYNSELQSELTSTIGEANYDIGHLFANLQNNGNAGCIGCVCVNGQKGSGWTSATVPEGDFFDVDYVSHEMGHQFGANHTWTFGGNEGTNVQVEPGSGTTIMSYAGITGATDVEPNVTPNFHAVSIEQVTDYVKSTSCQTETITGNAVPVVNAGSNYTIPNGTAFILEGSATDADTPSNQLTYVWEQMDENNASTTNPSPNNTTGVAFRAYEPTSDTFRYFPRLETIKTGATSWQWEAVPEVARTLNFRLTVRDNVVGGGTNNSDDVVVTVNGTAGPFVVNTPNTNETWNAGSFATVTWDVAGTTGNGVNAANVDIFLSTDGGDTYPITLASGVTNDGSHDIVVPNNQGTQNRIMVRGSNHIFFDISDTNFTIDPPIACTATVPTNFTVSSVGATSATLDWDTISVVVFDIQYRVIGSGTWIDESTANNTLDLTGLTPETDYEARVRSRCPDNSTSAYTSIITFSTPVLPPCSGTQITAFPYAETFDSGLGDWTQASGDDGDWIVDNAGTPSPNTGPSDDISTGGNYLYIEASTNGTPGEIGANASAVLESPCFDLTGLTSATLSFYYHMYGADTGSLEVEVSNDDGNSWTSVFNQSGDQGDTWNAQNVDLLAYLNQNIKIRITGTTGDGFASDIAIDQIGIGDPIVIPLNYCVSSGNTSFETGVTRVIFGSIDNVDGSPKDVGYEDFTSISTDVLQGSTVDLTVQVDTDGNYVVHAFAWIDWNIDGDFDDPGEEYDLGDIQNVADGALPTLSITIPESMIFGSTRMRVSAQYDQDPTSCLTNFDGEVEDYTVNVRYDGLLFSGGSWDPSAPDGSSTADNILILDGTYDVTTAISVNDIIVNTGATLNVPSNSSVTLGGDITNNGEFIMNSDSNEFSSLMATGTITGTIKYLRHVNSNPDGNDLIAPPLSGETFASFAGNNPNILANTGQTQYLFGPFEKPLNQYVLYSDTETATLDAGIGYRTGSTDDGTFTFEGSVTTGPVNVPIVKTGLDFDKWNLIGNPYTTYIRLDAFLAANLNELDSQSVAIYGYDADISNGSLWSIWNVSYSDANPGALVAPGQGFFVTAKDGGSTVSFTPAMQEIGNTDDFILGRSSNYAHFILRMESSDKAYETDVYFKDVATLGLDIGYDAEIFQETPSPFMIYTELTENNIPLPMAIQSIGFEDVNGTTLIPLGVNLPQGEQVSITLNTQDLEYDVYLEDTLENTSTLLNTTAFNLSSSTDLMGTGRFYLRFEAETLSVTESVLDDIKVFNDSNVKQIVVSGQLSENTTLTLYDIQGREIVRSILDASSTVNTIDTTNYANGVYLVQISDTIKTISKKLIIK